MKHDTAAFERPSLTDIAYREIRNGILRGSLAPGRKLVVNELVEEWKVSNTPIKEALNRLVADELVVALPRRGMQVRTYNQREMREIFELRALHEVHCCRFLAKRVGELPEVAKELEAILVDCRNVLARGDITEMLLDLDSGFHEYIVKQCDNLTLARNFHRLHAHSIAIGSAINQNCSPERWAETQKEHERILQGILAGSPDTAEHAMRVHLGKTCTSLQEVLKKKSARSKPRTR